MKIAYIVCYMSQAKIPGMCFVKIHAPWNVLCREAEFMKLKMPTKKVRITVSGWTCFGFTMLQLPLCHLSLFVI